ncbi:MAG: alpha-ketoacid dehydrogenase subunit beta, partial [Rhodospirillales bacterium]|nr:alpha-ketoacid dehydrogenase subunit beta [Rhodospirillales bacterium]
MNIESKGQERIITLADAIREGITEAFARDDRTFLFAQGVADPSAMWGTLKGVGNRFGEDRVIEMPVAENGAVGIAVGAALNGQRPVISFHRAEFALLALEQIVNNAAKSHYISNGQHKVPLVIRMVIGRGWGQGPEHSQSLEPVFSYFPGLKVVMPAFAADAKGMLIAAIEDDNPVIFIEHRFVHYATGHVPEGYYSNALDGPRVVRDGDDVTIVAASHAVLEAIRAADQLREIGLRAEVIDLRVMRPLNMAPIQASVKKTGRLITVDTGFVMYGIGAEIVANVVTQNLSALRAPPVRLGLPDHPTP